ncbi:putative glycosyltransferase family 31 protein [Botrytis fragariae]|uniref:Putative glycosyltransferase family 31 protein n=1 Tax=Botrytis fragariae TaxID=1964551 RepID=A0A8H6AQH0_9HELO|nr:putative glycosyltransferase family 31 protein [Botrytis fragariae]KAF5871722.1 putative glycosyltransferase family 31 protein [Botrytis fragariae]
MTTSQYGAFLPRHLKGYLWISFLVAVFIVMGLSENNVLFVNRSANWDATDGGPLLQDYSINLDVPSTTPLASPPINDDNSYIKPVAEEPSRIHSSTCLDPKDVVILVKTGATSIWRRMPMHMSTTLGNKQRTPNVVYYSDIADNINGNPVIDSLANVSATLKASPDFVLYNKAKEVLNDNLYQESAGIEGDSYLPGGWRLDKYKFLPMFQHAAIHHPGKKWYVYMEDDNYFFWETLYAWLSTLDHTSPLLIGSPAFKMGEDFAHGGSGIAVSGKAMATSFGAEKTLADKYEFYAKDHCCGDQVLSHAMKEMGVERFNELDGGGWAALQSLPIWRIGFGDWNWCSPLMNIHKVHQADISQLFVFENQFMQETKGKGRIRYRDVFKHFFAPKLVAARSEWNNYASVKSFSSTKDSWSPDLKALTAAQKNERPWASKENCKKACVDWDECLTWKYQDDDCHLSHTAAIGAKANEGVYMESGWMVDRIRKVLEKKECGALDF